jgi:hypothetical protein
MSLGPTINIFGDKHSLLYWVFFFGLICGVTGVAIYRKNKGLAEKYYDAKLISFLLLLCLGLIILWKYILYSTVR